MVDRVRVLKQESAATGGNPADEVDYPSPADNNNDALDARGYYIQNGTSNDSSVMISRDASSNLVFTDASTSKTLTELVPVALTARLVDFIEEGPVEGFTTGATKVVTGTVFPTQILWKRADTTKLVEKNITWTGPLQTTIQWKFYAANGTTVLVTATDTISYSGVFETGRTRTIV